MTACQHQQQHRAHRRTLFPCRLSAHTQVDQLQVWIVVSVAVGSFLPDQLAVPGELLLA